MGESPAVFRVQDSGFWVQGSGFRVQVSGFRFQGSIPESVALVLVTDPPERLAGGRSCLSIMSQDAWSLFVADESYTVYRILGPVDPLVQVF